MNSENSKNTIIIIAQGNTLSSEVSTLLNELVKSNTPQKRENTIELYTEQLVFKHSRGIKISTANEVMRIQAMGNYSTIFFITGEELVVAKTMKHYEAHLNTKIFVRIHQSHIINIQHIESYKNGRSGTVKMKSGVEIPVSRNRKQGLLYALNNINLNI